MDQLLDKTPVADQIISNSPVLPITLASDLKTPGRNPWDIITMRCGSFRSCSGQKDLIMPTGTVKWFNNAKGYGFILADEGGEDLFAHYSAIHMDGYKTLKAGQPVAFDVTQGDKGLHAININCAANAAISNENPHPLPATALA